MTFCEVSDNFVLYYETPAVRKGDDKNFQTGVQVNQVDFPLQNPRAVNMLFAP